MTRYRMEGLDCPVCAQGLEEGLRKFEGVKSVTVDFATLTLHVDALDVAAVEAEAKRLEPGLGLLRVETDRPGLKPAVDPKEVAGIGVAVAIAGAGFALELARATVGWAPAVRALPFVAAWLVAGFPVLAGAAKNIARGRVFDELFLMSIATLGAIAIGAWEEAVGVMVFYRVGELLQDLAIARARASIRALTDLKPAKARLLRGGEWRLVAAEEVLPGDLVLVLAGEASPVDGLVESGRAAVDTRALTGEPAPRDLGPGSRILGGSIALDGSLEVRAGARAAESQVAKIADLVERASARKAKAERFITRFAAWYTPAVVAVAAATALLPPLLLPGASFADWLHRALVMLVISCPCALVLSIPLGYFAGLGGAARRGILVRGGETLDALSRVDTVVFDKTGTLSLGAFEVLGVEAAEGFEADSVLALAAEAESRSRHPLAAAVLREARSRGLAAGEAGSAIEVRELPGRGIVARSEGREIVVGNRALLAERGIAVGDGADSAVAASAAAVLHVAVDGRAAGRILAGDEARPEAAAVVEALHGLGVGRFALLTGDSGGPTAALAARVGIADARHSLDPEGKLRELEAIAAEGGAGGGALMFVGDGTNDAPVIARADVGVAVGGGADAALETADIVLLSDGLRRLPEALGLARRTRTIVRENVIFAIGAKSAFLVLGALGLAGMWLAVVADVGVALLAVLNATRALAPLSPRRVGGRPARR